MKPDSIVINWALLLCIYVRISKEINFHLPSFYAPTQVNRNHGAIAHCSEASKSHFITEHYVFMLTITPDLYNILLPRNNKTLQRLVMFSIVSNFLCWIWRSDIKLYSFLEYFTVWWYTLNHEHDYHHIIDQKHCATPK